MSSTRSSDPDDPVSYFLRDMELHGKSDRTQSAYERVLSRFERFLDQRDGGLDPGAAAHRDCTAFVHELRTDSALADSTVATYAAYLHRFYAYMTQVGEFDANPMTLVAEEMDERINTDPTRREIAVPEMRDFLAGIAHPLDRALLVTMLKTGIRVGELCNLDV
ncbi:MAG: tyrosine-type recombinase/integrase, partial [Halobaculum sp.]